MYKLASAEINDRIWKSYIKSRDLYLRNQILSAYLYIVKVNAHRLSGACRSREDREEIVNQGVLALIGCIEKFDPARGVQFDTFASIRVRGAIIDYIRKQDWVPRDLRKKFTDISAAYAQMQSELGREPTDEEVAARLDMKPEEIGRVMAQADGFALMPFEEMLQESASRIGDPDTGVITPEQELIGQELKETLAVAIDKLSGRERMVVSLYYYDGVKLKEIAVLLKLTPSRVSQIHAKALMKLRQSMQCYMLQD